MFLQKRSVQWLMILKMMKPWTLNEMFLIWFVLPQCNLMYGWKLYSYNTLLHAAKTIISLQLGIFNYEEVCEIIIYITVY